MKLRNNACQITLPILNCMPVEHDWKCCCHSRNLVEI